MKVWVVIDRDGEIDSVHLDERDAESHKWSSDTVEPRYLHKQSKKEIEEAAVQRALKALRKGLQGKVPAPADDSDWDEWGSP